jgi:hypothetical protein
VNFKSRRNQVEPFLLLIAHSENLGEQFFGDQKNFLTTHVH